MLVHGNNARMIRMMVENLHNLARDYGDANMLEQSDEVNEVAEAVGQLQRLPEPEEAE